MSKLARVWVLSLASAFGCSASSQTTPPSSNPATTELEVEDPYAAALDEAFNTYEDEVLSAALLDYASVAEAEAVVRTLSGQHFDSLLAAALHKRGLSMRDLAQFAESHAGFFHEQQREHWGKLQKLEATLATLPQRVKPVAVDDSFLAFDVR